MEQAGSPSELGGGCKVPLLPGLSKQTDRSAIGTNAEQTDRQTDRTGITSGATNLGARLHRIANCQSALFYIRNLQSTRLYI